MENDTYKYIPLGSKEELFLDKENILTSVLFSRFEFGAMVAMTWYTMDMLIH